MLLKHELEHTRYPTVAHFASFLTVLSIALTHARDLLLRLILPTNRFLAWDPLISRKEDCSKVNSSSNSEKAMHLIVEVFSSSSHEILLQFFLSASLSRAFFNSKADSIVGTLDNGAILILFNRAIFHGFCTEAGLSATYPRRLRAHPTRLLPISIHEVLCCACCVFAVGRPKISHKNASLPMISSQPHNVVTCTSARNKVPARECLCQTSKKMNVDEQVLRVFESRGVADDVFPHGHVQHPRNTRKNSSRHDHHESAETDSRMRDAVRHQLRSIIIDTKTQSLFRCGRLMHSRL